MCLQIVNFTINFYFNWTSTIFPTSPFIIYFLCQWYHRYIGGPFNIIYRHGGKCFCWCVIIRYRLDQFDSWCVPGYNNTIILDIIKYMYLQNGWHLLQVTDSPLLWLFKRWSKVVDVELHKWGLFVGHSS
jgi:hypothetical protein